MLYLWFYEMPAASAHIELQSFIKPPPGVEVYDTPILIFWIDAEGILCSIGKPVPHTLEPMKETVAILKKVLNGKIVCSLADNTHSQYVSKTVREYVAQEMPHLYKAVASISRSYLGKTIVNFYLVLKPPPFPMRMFNSEDQARNWLRQYL